MINIFMPMLLLSSKAMSLLAESGKKSFTPDEIAEILSEATITCLRDLEKSTRNDNIENIVTKGSA